MEKVLFSYLNAQLSNSHPLFLIEEKKQLYTGVRVSTLSPTLVNAFITADNAGTTPDVYMNHSRLGFQWWRRLNHEITAS